MPRLFVALPVPPAVQARLAAVQAEVQASGLALRQARPEGLHLTLAFLDQRLKGETLRGEPEPVVDQLRIFRDQRIAEVHHLAVHRQGFNLPMGEMKNRAARRFVHAAAFHADEPVFDHVHAADTVFTAQLVERLHDPER